MHFYVGVGRQRSQVRILHRSFLLEVVGTPCPNFLIYITMEVTVASIAIAMLATGALGRDVPENVRNLSKSPVKMVNVLAARYFKIACSARTVVRSVSDSMIEVVIFTFPTVLLSFAYCQDSSR